MNAIIAQAAALAAHARARRIDPKLGGDEDYWTRHSTFQFVRSLRFAVGKRRLFWSSATDIASTPPQWMATLPLNDDVSFVSVRSSITRTGNPASGLLGVAQEPVAIQTGASPALWVPSWRTVARYPETKIWAVKYVRRESGASIPAPQSFDEARQNLAVALREIRELASSRSALSDWESVFVKAEEQLDARNPVAPYHPDILPPGGYSLSARQLLTASVTAFVFGGMGSWNDVWFDHPQERARYELVTRQLHAAVLDGLAASVNHRH